MKLPINNDNVNFETLEEKMLKEAEAKAEVQKQKMIIKGKMEQENIRMMTEMMNNMNKTQLYGLNECKDVNLNIENNSNNNKNNNLKLVAGKEKIIMALILIIMLILAIGITPTGAWFEMIQSSYVDLLVDFFRMGLLGLGGFLVYKLFKK